MNYDRILIRYGEMSTKGRNRHAFVEKLGRNIRYALHDFSNIRIKSTRDRMYILLNGENGRDMVDRLKRVFGIQSFSPVIKTGKEIEEIKATALKLFKQVYQEGNSFKITTKRADKTFFMDTDEMNHTLGGHILQNVPNIKVNVKKPDINLQIEIRTEAAYLFCETIQGAGGLPAGSSGKAMLMLSGGIDSPVAGYLSLKRGLEVEGVHFFSPPFTSERAKQKVLDIAAKLSERNGHFRLHIVPFTEIQQLIHKQIPENYTMTATRRMMLRITDALREKQEALAIITGESLGQVASQTLESMYAINEVTNTPILRPLIMMDKPEIIKMAEEIDTFEISNRPFEDCCTIFVPPSPKTKPKREKVIRYESFFDFAPYIQKAVEQTETILIKPETQLSNEFEELF
ncbi:tRNA uracil 4-sulfurtransferase ThiI [Bacillus benzoevorans]|uniref:Probable tRNA sulfurtransferase n=1 Tax=Bacillus benzoevorans TaxID=1456 RepID=A0A7X0LV79_9BACI|nr:tRNA uracil 4-sulfurtransferase ThiI [Bacillus benzoevorans]MBB6445721.1 thiamine biosynthesis protein ThiI [Bacillus benzoevorans]